MPYPHRQCASVLITDSESRILFVRQSYGHKFSGFPGGIVDSGETPPMAAVREALEEACIEVALDYQIGAYLLTGRGWPDIFASVYKARIIKGEPKADLLEISELMWRRADNPPSTLLPDAEAALEDFVNNRRGVTCTYLRKATTPAWE